MTLDKVIQLLKTERECVIRQDTPLCNRDECGCQCCDLVQDPDEILDMYNTAVDCVTFAKTMCEEITALMITLGFDDLDEFRKYCKKVTRRD